MSGRSQSRGRPGSVTDLQRYCVKALSGHYQGQVFVLPDAGRGFVLLQCLSGRSATRALIRDVRVRHAVVSCDLKDIDRTAFTLHATMCLVTYIVTQQEPLAV